LYAALAGDERRREALGRHRRRVRALDSRAGQGDRPDRTAGRRTAGRSVDPTRRPYIDPLSHIQVRFLARLRSLPADDPDRERFRRLVQLTVNGVAAGLQNTG
jgi:phosphoenolpyruvate carboxylase